MGTSTNDLFKVSSQVPPGGYAAAMSKFEFVPEKGQITRGIGASEVPRQGSN
jgi:hypothetical protein